MRWLALLSSLIIGILLPMTAPSVLGSRTAGLVRCFVRPSSSFRSCVGHEVRQMRPRFNHATSAEQSRIPHMAYHIAAASSGKGRKFNADKNTYEFSQQPIGDQKGWTPAAKKASRPDSGQDAFFVSRVGDDAVTTAFGIADGVGGWADQNVDPADFSHGLCTYLVDTAVGWKEDQLHPLHLLNVSYYKLTHDPTVKAGGSTACVGIAGKDGRVHIANLGDSGFLQLRLGAVQNYSNPQTHAFNTPYQLSQVPPKLLAQAAVFGGQHFTDTPDRADVSSLGLKHGDVLILASDGVWDNLNAQDVLHIVGRRMREHGAWQMHEKEGITVSQRLSDLVQPGGLEDESSERTLQGVVAAAIASEAKVTSMNDQRDGPFAREVQKHFPDESFHGGKVDDISVIALIPVETEPDLRAKL